MKLIKNIFWGFIISFLTLMTTSCSSSRSLPTPTINLALTSEAFSNRFAQLDYGIRLNFRDGRNEYKKKVLIKHDQYVTSTPTVQVNPDVMSFVRESVRRYMRTMGFNLDADIATDYIMTIEVSEYNVSYISGIGWSGVVNMKLEVHDSDNKLVYPNTTITGRANISGNGNNYTYATQAINKAYSNALEDIDWDRIAYYLKRSDSPAKEANKQVDGDGETALEHTVLNWEVTSRPAGADVYWRIISSTPDVKNTNKNYKSTTPYESTETFDIKGLTYNNSGNVQIEILCEKPGYLPQKKVFNLRSAIDQKSINAHFTLVKDE